MLTDHDLLRLAGSGVTNAELQNTLARHGVKPTRMWQRVNELIHSMEGQEMEPAICDRLRERQERRTRRHATISRAAQGASG